MCVIVARLSSVWPRSAVSATRSRAPAAGAGGVANANVAFDGGIANAYVVDGASPSSCTRWIGALA